MHQGTTQADKAVLCYSGGVWIYALGEAEKKKLQGAYDYWNIKCVYPGTHIFGDSSCTSVGKRREVDNLAALDIWLSLQYLTSPFAFDPNQKPDVGTRKSLSPQGKMIN